VYFTRDVGILLGWCLTEKN